MHAFNNLKIRSKILFIVLIFFVGLGISFWLSMTTLRHELFDSRENKTEQMIDVAYGIVARYEGKVRAGVLTEQQAKEEAIGELRVLRYGTDYYFFIISNDLHMILNPPKPELEGKDASDITDTDGSHIFQEMAALVKKSGSGFYYYQWQKPGVAQPSRKLSFIKAFTPWGWMVGTGMYLDNVDKLFHEQLIESGSVSLGITALAIVFSLLISGIITRPLHKATEGMKKLADGDASIEITDTERRDEIGEIARSLLVFKDNILEKTRLQREQEEAKKAAEQEKKAMMKKLASDFESSVQGIITSVASASTELYQTAEGMQVTVTNVSQQSGNAASASQQTTSSVQSVTAAVEEMSASVREIASQVGKSSSLITETVNKTQQADKTTKTLSEAVTQISGILDLIQNIAGQINLLALNATIGSARAGDAGKGFAVVASEVKNLAGQTSKATEQIAAQITSVQQASKEVVDVLKVIQHSIGEVNQYASGIASAVEEQSAATNDISRNMQQAAQGVELVTTNLNNINKSAADADHASKEVLSAAQMLSKQSEMLNTEVSKFIANLTADSADFDDAIKAHKGWKTKLSNYIAHPNNSINHDEVGLDNHCMFGKWMQNNSQKYDRMPEFDALKAEHTKFHRITGDIVRRINSGQRVLETEISESSEFGRASSATIDAILRLKAKIG